MTKARFYSLIALAAVIRILLMPISMHKDLIFIHYFPYFLSAQGIWDIYGYFGTHYLDMGFTYYQPLVYYFIAFFQWITQWVNPGFDLLMQNAHGIFYAGKEAAFSEYLQSFDVAQNMRFTFLMKFPYLAADLGIFFILMHLRLEESLKQKILLFWLFHPVLIFSCYVFGQYRILGCLLMWLVLYFALAEKTWPAFIAYGFLLLTDTAMLILFLPAWLCLTAGRKGRAQALLWTALPLVGILLPLVVTSKGAVLASYFSPLVQKVASGGIVNFGAAWSGPGLKAAFILWYLFILIRLLQKNILSVDSSGRARLFIHAGASILLFFYAATPTVIHYFLWILPLYVMIQAEGRLINSALSWSIVGLLFIFNLDSRALNLGLLAPLGADFFMSLPCLHEVMDRWMPWGKLIGGFRVLFSALCIVAAWKIYDRGIRTCS